MRMSSRVSASKLAKTPECFAVTLLNTLLILFTFPPCVFMREIRSLDEEIKSSFSIEEREIRKNSPAITWIYPLKRAL